MQFHPESAGRTLFEMRVGPKSVPLRTSSVKVLPMGVMLYVPMWKGTLTLGRGKKLNLAFAYMGQVLATESSLRRDDCITVEDTPAARLVMTPNSRMILGLLSGEVLAFAACYVPLATFALQTAPPVLPGRRQLSSHNLGFALTLSTFDHAIFNAVFIVHDEDSVAGEDVVIQDERSWDPIPIREGGKPGLGEWTNGILSGSFTGSIHVHFSVLRLNARGRDGNTAVARQVHGVYPLLLDGRGRATLTVDGPPKLRIVFEAEDQKIHISSLVVGMGGVNRVGTW